MPNINVAVINASTAVDDNIVRQCVPAFQKQVHEHLAPSWGVDADLTFFTASQQPPAGYWWLVILDNSDQAGALGYHDLTDEGMPLGKVFAKTDEVYGYNWTVTATHELLEMLIDPNINLTVFDQRDPETGTLYAYEVCD